MRYALAGLAFIVAATVYFSSRTFIPGTPEPGNLYVSKGYDKGWYGSDITYDKGVFGSELKIWGDVYSYDGAAGREPR